MMLSWTFTICSFKEIMCEKFCCKVKNDLRLLTGCCYLKKQTKKQQKKTSVRMGISTDVLLSTNQRMTIISVSRECQMLVRCPCPRPPQTAEEVRHTHTKQLLPLGRVR